MIACGRGDVVLVGFVFSDESGRKVRPALVISSPAYLRARGEVVVAAITSNVRRRLFADHLFVGGLEGGRAPLPVGCNGHRSNGEANDDRPEAGLADRRRFAGGRAAATARTRILSILAGTDAGAGGWYRHRPRRIIHEKTL